MRNKLMALIASAAFFTALSASAQKDQGSGSSTFPQPREVMDTSEWKPHVGLVAGFAAPEGRGNSSGEYGIDIGYQPYIPYGVGLEYTHGEDIDNGTTTQDRDTVWLKGSYHFGGDTMIIKDSYAGLGLAAVMKSDGTSVAAAPILGFDIPIKQGMEAAGFFSLGANARYAVVSDGDVDTFSLSGVVKYWY